MDRRVDRLIMAPGADPQERRAWDRVGLAFELGHFPIVARDPAHLFAPGTWIDPVLGLDQLESRLRRWIRRNRLRCTDRVRYLRSLKCSSGLLIGLESRKSAVDRLGDLKPDRFAAQVPGRSIHRKLGLGPKGARSDRNEPVLDIRDALVRRERFEDLQVGFGKEGFGDALKFPLGTEQMAIEPNEAAELEFLGVFVATGGPLDTEVAFRVERIERAQLLLDAKDASEWKNGVFVGVAYQQGARMDHRAQGRKVPTVAVVEEHAVAVPSDDLIDDLIAKIGHTRDRYSDSNPRIDRGCIPAISPPAAAAGNTDLGRIDLGPSDQIIDGSDRVPSFDSCGGIPPGGPVPAIETVKPVVDPFDLTELDRVDGHGDVALPGKPSRMVLVVGFVPEAHPILFDLAMPADIENRRQGFIDLLGQIEVPGDVESWTRLEVDLFHDKVLVLERPGRDRMELARARLQRGQAEHFGKLPAECLLSKAPWLLGAESSQVVGPFDLLDAGAQGSARQLDPRVALGIRGGLSQRELSQQDRGGRKNDHQEQGGSIPHGRVGWWVGWLMGWLELGSQRTW